MPKSNRRRNLRIALAAIGLLALLGVGTVFRPRGSEIPVRQQTLQYATFRTKLPESGVLQRPKVQTVAAEVGGTIGTLLVRPGDSVQAGQLLATLRNPQIISTFETAAAAYRSAAGRAHTVTETNATLPTQNRSAVVQAQAGLEQAKVQLQQAIQDRTGGAQSGLGYGGTTAEEQRLAADANVSRAQTDLREAQRVLAANKDLYDQGAISRDALAQSQARYDQALLAANQAVRQRQILGSQLARTSQVLDDRVRAARDQLRQAQAALAAARANATQSKAGDLEAARGDAARAADDLAFARDQVARLQIRAPFAGVIQTVATQPGDTLRPLAPGDAIQVNQTLFTLATHDRFIVRTKVDEQDIAAVRIGQRALISGEDFAGKTLPGHVTAISPIAQKSDDPSNTSRQVVTTVALEKKLPFLRDGMTVDVDIITHEVPHALVVSVDALRHDAKGDYVFVVHDKQVRRTAVTLGPKNDASAVIKSGASAGDLIVVDKTPLTDGKRVKPAPTPSSSVPSAAATAS